MAKYSIKKEAPFIVKIYRNGKFFARTFSVDVAKMYIRNDKAKQKGK